MEGRTGVWVDHESPATRKIAAIGVRVAKGVTMHGFALNCDNTLSGFQQIVACGIEDAQVSTISAELDRQIGAKDLLEPVKQAMMATLISR